MQEKDLGYSIGGPVGKPGGRNKLFFFYSHEYAPRTGGNDVQRFRMPTALERAGDFSQTIDNNGALYPFIRDPNLAGACSATSQVACFRDGGVVGRIPANRLYDTGLNILKMYPMPNINRPGEAYNYENTRPTENLTANQPAVRIDYQPMNSLRATFKYSGWSQKNQVINGTIPGFNDSKQYKPVVSTWAATGNYTFNPTTFLEATYGHSQNELTGCGLAQGGTGPTFCQNGFAMNPIGNRFNAGLGNIPYLFPDANVIDPSYYAFEALSGVSPPNFVDGRVVVPPNFAWGSRVSNNNPNYAPPNTPFPGFLNINATDDISISLTKVAGRHTIKTGFYNTHSYKAQQRGGWNGTITFSNDNNNPIDSTFGYANAALGIFSQYAQASKYVEGSFVYNNTEAYIQDNWKVTNNLTLDYGVRFVHQQPQYRRQGTGLQFPAREMGGGPGAPAVPCGLPEQRQPVRRRQPAGHEPADRPASGTGHECRDWCARAELRQYAERPVPVGSGYRQHHVYLAGAGHCPAVRNGVRRDRPPEDRPSRRRRPVLRPAERQLHLLAGAESADVYEHHRPERAAADVGQHRDHRRRAGPQRLRVRRQSALVHAVERRDTAGPAMVLGARRRVRGSAQLQHARRRGHQRHRLRRGIPAAESGPDAPAQRDPGRDGGGAGPDANQSTGARLQHNADGTYALRSDQAEADELLGTVIANRHLFKGNFVWDLPDVRSDGSFLKALGVIVNDWQVSGVWTGATGSAYTVGFSYQNGGGNVNLTGSPSYGARIRVMGDPGSGCSGNVYQQFNTSAFQGPLTNSVGLESGADYLRGCFTSTLDLSIARNIRLGGVRNLQLRVDLFNAPNSAIITGRNTTINLSNPNDPVTATNLPYDANGNLIESRSLPRTAGFGVANAYQAARSVQAQVRFSF